ncbi:hypothetical protein NL676_024300 [Syzygium grande]|nr:hypothetical protein NL676_024300 [Syzygium grande]
MVGIIAAVTSLSLPPPPAFPSLEAISIVGCDKMKRVVESEWLPHFLNLRRIKVKLCKNMEEITGGAPPYMPVKEISLEFLTVLVCNNMRNLFPHELLIHCRNLQSITVNCCKGMVEMISKAGQGQEGSIMTPVNNTPSSFQCSNFLSKLKSLQLFDLPQLKSICEVPLSCDFMEDIVVSKCPELSTIPLQLRLRYSSTLSPFLWHYMCSARQKVPLTLVIVRQRKGFPPMLRSKKSAERPSAAIFLIARACLFPPN